MVLKNILIIFSCFLITPSFADTNSSDSHESSYLDYLHNTLSDDVYKFSNYVDNLLTAETGSDNNQSIHANDSLDLFFQTNKFEKETRKSYLLINTSYTKQTKYPNDFAYDIRAHLPLSKSTHKYNLFIEDLRPNDTAANTKSTSPTAVGVNYFSSDAYGIKSKYSLGISSIHPFVRARYSTDFEIGKWVLEPVQTFRYSLHYELEEETDIYFDRKISSDRLFRLLFYRYTGDTKVGMDYSFHIQYFHTLDSQTAFSISQSASGNTKYKDIPYGTDPSLNHEEYSGINNYATSMSWRQNIWKKWFFYEVRPGLNMHREHDYEINYSIVLSLDIYLGKTYIR